MVWVESPSTRPIPSNPPSLWGIPAKPVEQLHLLVILLRCLAEGVRPVVLPRASTSAPSRVVEIRERWEEHPLFLAWMQGEEHPEGSTPTS